MLAKPVLVLAAFVTASTSLVVRQKALRIINTRRQSAQSATPMSMKLTVNAWQYTNGLQDPRIPVPGNPQVGDRPLDFTVSQEQIDILKRDGVVHIRGALSQEWLDYLTQSTEWQIKNPHIWASPGVASGIYDYIQRSIWTTNEAFANFLYYSPLATILAKLGETEEIRLSTDLLMVNPNSGFKWHQDNQNGPVLFDDALRWWVTMDDTPADYGAPVYLKGSHKNKSVKKDAVFVDLDDGDLRDFPEQLEFRPKAGDMIVWNARTIHKIDGPENKDWGSSKRRVLGGTGVVAGAKYYGEKRALFSDMASHDMKDGDVLCGPQWPRLYPTAVASEVAARKRGDCSRSMEGFLRMSGNMLSSIGEMGSWVNVLNKKKVLDDTSEDPEDMGAVRTKDTTAVQR